jgi:hypothetical protein
MELDSGCVCNVGVGDGDAIAGLTHKHRTIYILVESSKCTEHYAESGRVWKRKR